MLLIFGVTLPKDKKVLYALPKLYGIGKASALKICNECNSILELSASTTKSVSSSPLAQTNESNSNNTKKRKSLSLVPIVKSKNKLNLNLIFCDFLQNYEKVSKMDRKLDQ